MSVNIDTADILYYIQMKCVLGTCIVAVCTDMNIRAICLRRVAGKTGKTSLCPGAPIMKCTKQINGVIV